MATTTSTKKLAGAVKGAVAKQTREAANDANQVGIIYADANGNPTGQVGPQSVRSDELILQTGPQNQREQIRWQVVSGQNARYQDAVKAAAGGNPVPMQEYQQDLAKGRYKPPFNPMFVDTNGTPVYKQNPDGSYAINPTANGGNAQADYGGSVVTGLQPGQKQTQSAISGPITQGGNAQGASSSGGTSDILDYVKQKDAATKSYLDNTVTPALQNQQSWLPGYVSQLADLNNQERAASDQYIQTNNGLIPRSQANVTAANQFSGANYAGLADQMSKLNAQDASRYGNLENTYASIANPLTAGGYGSDLTSMAAQARANASDVNNQNQTYNALSSLGRTQLYSKAADARANENDILNQQGAIDQIKRLGNTNLTSEARSAKADADALAAQKSALGQYGSLTTPTMTAAEQFILEKNRLAQEQDQRNSRGAIVRDRQARGMSGSGDEFAAQLLGGQQDSQNRLLGDLGAQAQAVQRSMDALKGYSDLGSMIADQSFNRDFNTKSAADAMAKQNMTNQLAASGQYADLSTAMRNAGFDEKYKAGSAADSMALGSLNANIAANSAAGGLATNMRNAGFDEAYKRGTSSDAVDQFNKSQSLIQQRYQDSYAQAERDSQASRALNLNAAGLANTAQQGGRVTTTYDAGTNTNKDIYGRSQDQLNSEAKINDANRVAGNSSRTAQAGNLSTAWGMGNNVTANTLSGAGVYTGGLNSTTPTVTQAMQTANANAAFEKFMKDQEKANNPYLNPAPAGLFGGLGA